MPSTTNEGRRERAKRQRRELILETVRRLIRESPTLTFTLAEVSERADVSIPTIANLIGTRNDIWAALADDALATIDTSGRDPDDPRRRAHQIVSAISTLLTADPDVHRAILRDWSLAVGPMALDPTQDIVECFTQAQTTAQTSGTSPDPRTCGEIVATTLVGCLLQWGAGLITEAGLNQRLASTVDLAFAGVGYQADPPTPNP